MKRSALLSLSLLLLTASVPAYAGLEPQAGIKDARIKTFDYDDLQVYRFTGHYGFSSVIEFSPEETIDSVSIGDSEAWQIVPSNKKNILFIKPILQNAQTNMTVITSSRIYSFELSAEKAISEASKELAYRIRFDYPDQKDKKALKRTEKYDPFEDKSKDDFNFKYSYAGSNTLKPLRVFDDGTFTYFRFKNFETMPAVFAVSEDGREALVNFTIKDEYMVITGTSAQFTLRAGDISTCIFNDILKGETAIQKKPAPIEEHAELENAFPIPARKPDLTPTASSGSFFSKLGSLFEGDSHHEGKAEGPNP